MKILVVIIQVGPWLFRTLFYNHALRLELGAQTDFLKPLLGPGGRFTSETAV